MGLSRIKSSYILNATIPFFQYDGTQSATFILVLGQMPFYKYDGTYDSIPIT